VTGAAAEGEACDDEQEESIGIGRIGSAGASRKIDHELNRSLIIQSRIILITRVLVHPLTFDRPAQVSRVRSANESEQMWLSVLRMRVIAVTAKRVFLKVFCSNGTHHAGCFRH
jgi:hypothetical protein